LTLPGLPVFEQLDDQKFLSTTTDLRNYRQIKRCKVLHQTGHTLGIQQYTVRKGDEWKAAFKTNKGLFEPTVMFFGMCNSLATCQAMMDNIFMTMIDKRLIIVYIDNILIFAKTEEELIRITKQVLEKLREHNLFLKVKKCKFCKTKIKYLSMIIEQGKIAMDLVKLGGIRDWPTPTTVEQVLSFLGFGNFY
jgi:Reverse transcriptase (RNA-dependent DNA polymerase)